MAQADQTIQNATFPTVRADINNNLAALFSDNSGNTAPTVTVAYQDWIDTSGTNPIWKKRNAANNAWITLGTIIGSTIAFEGASTLPSQTGNSGKFLTTNGTAASWASIISGINAADVFASSGNWTCPAGVTKVLVTVVGGGGGGRGGIGGTGANGGQEGGPGGFGVGFLEVTPGTVYTITIGAGGEGGAAGGGSGSPGGTSTFHTITATGGAAGTQIAGTVQNGVGTCTSESANIRRSHVGLAGPLFCDADSRAKTTAVAVAWSRDSAFRPGSNGANSAAGNIAGNGGVGGAVALLY